MKIEKLFIYSYKGISKPIEFDLTKESIFPLIGINECGKTTILQALLACDYTADEQIDGSHIANVQNLYDVEIKESKVGLKVTKNQRRIDEILDEIAPELDKQLIEIISEVVENEVSVPVEKGVCEIFLNRVGEILDVGVIPDSLAALKLSDLETAQKCVTAIPYVRELKDWLSSDSSGSLTLIRNLDTKTYSIEGNSSGGPLSAYINSFAEKVVLETDFIVYFDDFRHNVPEKVVIDSKDEWSGIFSTLFESANSGVKFAQLPSLEERRRKTVVNKAERFLNEHLTEQWEKFQLEDQRSLTIGLTYEDSDRPCLKIDVKENVEGTDYYFDLKDRSKGFYWFFNFVMRLEFNPYKQLSGNIIYLLDEPGSYLHARAQDQLCNKLMGLAEEHTVFYSTHSHHLLDPTVIPYNSIRIVEKTNNKVVTATPIHSFKSDRRMDAAFQPVFESLQLRPAAVDFGTDRVMVVEGISDFACFNMFSSDTYSIIPCVSAHSIRYHLSLLLAWGVDYRAVWDNDPEGRTKFDETRTLFGNEEAERSFRKLPLSPGQKNCKLENLVEGGDVKLIKAELGLPSNVKIKKAFVSLFYSKRRDSILAKISKKTKDNFDNALSKIWDDC